MIANSRSAIDGAQIEVVTEEDEEFDEIDEDDLDETDWPDDFDDDDVSSDYKM